MILRSIDKPKAYRQVCFFPSFHYSVVKDIDFATITCRRIFVSFSFPDFLHSHSIRLGWNHYES